MYVLEAKGIMKTFPGVKALQDVAAQEIEEEVYELPETEEATTTLGSLFANIKLS